MQSDSLSIFVNIGTIWTMNISKRSVNSTEKLNLDSETIYLYSLHCIFKLFAIIDPFSSLRCHSSAKGVLFQIAFCRSTGGKNTCTCLDLSKNLRPVSSIVSRGKSGPVNDSLPRSLPTTNRLIRLCFQMRVCENYETLLRLC